MLSVENKPIMSSVILLNVVMLSVVAPQKVGKIVLLLLKQPSLSHFFQMAKKDSSNGKGNN
jgi:hypothetical protein